jgi:hypothetical protein
MLKSRSVPSDSRPIELETVTDWRMIATGAGILLAFLIVPCVAAYVADSRPRLVVAEVSAPASRPIAPEPAAPVGPVAVIQPQLSFPPLEPYPVRKNAPLPAITIAPEPARPRVVAAIAPAATVSMPAIPEPVSRGLAFKNPSSWPVSLEEELIASLQKEVPEVKLDAKEGTSKQLLGASDKPHPMLALASQRGDLAGMPFRKAADCQASKEAADLMAILSRDVGNWRRRQPAEPKLDLSQSVQLAKVSIVEQSFRDGGPWNKPAAVGILEQVLEAETEMLRLVLVKQLSKISDPLASAALARRAVFDLSVEVRAAACEALRLRPASEARATFISAFRHPWPPAAQHAAEAIVYLADAGASGDLARLAQLPDPLAPNYDDVRAAWVQPELVRVNHLSNCLLCHAVSTGRKDLVRAPIPESGKPLPLVYYTGSRGPSVRADVTYMKQDFSVTLPVENAHPWPENQRFDFLVRQRVISEREAKILNSPRRDGYPQLRAVQCALHELKTLDRAESDRGRAKLAPDSPSAASR